MEMVVKRRCMQKSCPLLSCMGITGERVAERILEGVCVCVCVFVCVCVPVSRCVPVRERESLEREREKGS